MRKGADGVLGWGGVAWGLYFRLVGSGGSLDIVVFPSSVLARWKGLAWGVRGFCCMCRPINVCGEIFSC